MEYNVSEVTYLNQQSNHLTTHEGTSTKAM